jgi:hypothetical protein
MGFGPKIKWIHVDWTSLDVDLNWTLGPTALDNVGPDS